MKIQRRFLVAVILLAIVLLGSIALNYFLYELGRKYYLELNTTRLDPLGLSSFSTASEQLDLTSPERTTVVFFGDSRAESWPSPVMEDFEFINRGIGSQTSEQVLGRFKYHIKPLRPDVIVVQVGINDLKAIPLFPERKEGIVANCEENIEQIVSLSLAAGAKVILTTIFPIGEVPIERKPFWSDEVALAVNEVNEYIGSLEGRSVVVLNAYSILVGEGGLMLIEHEYSQDLLHLNSTGYERLNSEFVKTLRELK